MPEINGKEWTKKQVHAALKDDRAHEIWPDAVFERTSGYRGDTVAAADWDGKFGRVRFADDSIINFNFDPKYKG